MSPDEIGPTYVAAIRSDVLWVEVEDEVVVYDAARGMSHLLSSTARLIWQRLDGADTVETVALELATAFSADVEVVRKDVLSTLQELGRQGLLVGVDAAGGGS